ncbi:MAG TPA: hypothetical protein VF137_01435 [Candidatus Dormibacteraeota bacterium]
MAIGSERTTRLVTAAAAVVWMLALSARPAGAEAASLSLVGADPLAARGLNAGLAIADHCAYVGSRGQGPVEIVDIARPDHPTTAGQVAAWPGSTERELRAIPDQRVLVVLTYALTSSGVNRLDFYRWDADCTEVHRAGSYSFGSRAPHEMYLWHAGGRSLLFVSMFASGNPALQVVDVTNPANPTLAGGWSTPVGELHSISLSADGARAYLSLWRGGFLIADASDFTSFRANPTLHLLTQVADAVPAPAGGNVHSAVPVPGRDLVVLTDERYPPPACPYGPARLVNVSEPSHPRVISTLRAPQNDAGTCANAPVDVYTSHNPTLTPDLALVSWYASGLQVFDISSPAEPARLAEYRASAVLPGAIDPQLVGSGAMSWSYPIVRDGLIYLADINQGLLVLSYQGPHQDEVGGLAFAEGNSNLLAQQAAPAATPTGPRPAAGPISPTRKGSRPAAGPNGGAVAAAVILVLLAGAVFALRRRSYEGPEV